LKDLGGPYRRIGLQIFIPNEKEKSIASKPLGVTISGAGRSSCPVSNYRERVDLEN
jgi:hypothetical protein